MTEKLEPRVNARGQSVYCGLCWDPVFVLWVDEDAPDYTACPLGPYTAQTCPNALATARSAATFAELRGLGLTLKDAAPQPRDEPIEGDRSREAQPILPNPIEGRGP